MRAGVVEGVAAEFDSQRRLIPARQLGIVDISEEWIETRSISEAEQQSAAYGASG